MKESSATLGKNPSRMILLLLFAALLMTLTLSGGQSLLQLPQALANANAWWLAAAISAVVFYFSAQGINLKFLFASLGYTVSFRQSFGYALIDFYFSAITPGASGGQPAQLYYMQRHKLPVGAASLVILLFNMTYHIAAVILMITFLGLRSDFLAVQLGFGSIFLIYGVGIHLTLTLLFALAIFKPNLLKKLLHKILSLLTQWRIVKSPEKWRQTITDQINEYSRGAEHIKAHPFVLLRCQLISFAHLLALFSVPFCLFGAFSLNGFGYFDLTALQSALSISIDTLPLPGGVGAAEGGFMLIYQSIFANNLLPAMLLFRGLTFYAPLLGGGIAALIATKKNSR